MLMSLVNNIFNLSSFSLYLLIFLLIFYAKLLYIIYFNVILLLYKLINMIYINFYR